MRRHDGAARLQVGRRRRPARSLAAALTLLAGLAPSAGAEPPPEPGASFGGAVAAFLDGLKSNRFGSFYLKLRPRYEHADIEGFDTGNALTLRAVAGFGSRPWHGLSFLVEGEGIATADSDWYFDGTGRPSGKSFIPDPSGIDLNQGYLHYEQAEWTSHVRVGRQRLILDDARFVGNVGWRQNEQTFDAARLTTGLGRRDLHLTYAFLGQVLRIFGNRGSSATRNFDSSSHLVNLRWSALSSLKPTVFAYLLDFDDSPSDSSNSYGLRVTGTLPLDSALSVEYSASYAFQTDAADNPDDYEAHYAWVQGALAHESLGAFGVGFELLGSDDGRARFRTPIATVHVFNGWADVFLDNGGDDGLRDLFVRVLPELPWKLTGELAFHHFWSDQGGRRLGWEVDAYLARPLSRFVTVLAKMAYFDSSSSARPDVTRAWLQLTFEF